MIDDQESQAVQPERKNKKQFDRQLIPKSQQNLAISVQGILTFREIPDVT